MIFTVTGSSIAEMNGEYEVTGMGLVNNLTQGRLLKPGIEHVVNWMCEKGGLGLIFIGDSYFRLHVHNESRIMDALGYGNWPECILGKEGAE
jgi:hypothetical protein